MTGFPTLLVELEDGAGAFTNDITASVNMASGWIVRRGRNDEEADIEPGRITLRLDNPTGVFTLGSASFNGIFVDKRIRISETVGGVTTRRAVGYVQSWPAEWESPSGNVAIVNITAMDRFSRLNRRKLLPMVQHELLADAPAFLYALGEDAGSLSAGDSSGVGRPALPIVGPVAGAAPAFGSALSSWDGIEGAAFAVNGQILYGTGQLVTAGTTLTLALTVVPNGSNGTWVELVDIGRGGLPGLGVGINGSGQITAFDLSNHGAPATVVSTTTVYTGGEHAVELVMSGSTMTLWVDGVSIGSGPATAFGAISAGMNLALSIGGDIAGAGKATVASTLGMVAGYTTALSSTRIAAHATAILTGFPADTADQRIARLAGYASIPTADQNLEVGQQPSIAASPTAGVNALPAMNAVMDAEGGVVFIAGDGRLTMHNKAHRVIRAGSAAGLALAAGVVDHEDLTFGGEKDYLVNTATGGRPNGATQRSVNAASLAQFEEYDGSLDSVLLSSDALVLDRLTWLTTVYGTARSRIATFTLNLLTLPQATVQAALALELGDRVTIAGLFSQSPGGTSADLIVEGVTETQIIGPNPKWTLTFNTVPSALFKAPIYDDAATATYDTGLPVYF